MPNKHYLPQIQPPLLDLYSEMAMMSRITYYVVGFQLLKWISPTSCLAAISRNSNKRRCKCTGQTWKYDNFQYWKVSSNIYNMIDVKVQDQMISTHSCKVPKKCKGTLPNISTFIHTTLQKQISQIAFSNLQKIV